MTRHLVPFSALEQTIQAGQCADSPEILYHYLELIEEHAEHLDISSATALHERVFNVLLDTVCDTNVAQQWRQTCLDKIYIPLRHLKRLIVTYQDARRYFKMEHNLRALSHYFVS